MLEKQRDLEEEKRQIESDFKKNEKKAQEIILNKKNSRPKLSFGLKSVPKWNSNDVVWTLTSFYIDEVEMKTGFFSLYQIAIPMLL